MSYEQLISAINILSCIVIIVKVITWRRINSRYRPGISALAWLISVSCSAVIFFIIFGLFRFAEWSETMINMIFACSVVYTNGNIAHLFKEKK